MNDHEHGHLRTVLTNASPRLAEGLRTGLGHEEALADDDQLSPTARAWVEGFVAGQLTVLRGASTEAQTLSPDDTQSISELVTRHEGEIAAALYA